MTMTTIPDTNSGTVAADSPVTEMTRSVARPYVERGQDPAEDAERHHDDEGQRGRA